MMRFPRLPLLVRASFSTTPNSKASSSSVTIQKSAQQISERTVALQLLMTRWGCESALYSINASQKGTDAEEDEKKIQKERISEGYVALDNAIKSPNVNQSLFTKREKELLALELGKWSPVDDVGAIHSKWESLGVLLWALRIFKDIAPYTQNIDLKPLFNSTAIIPASPSTITAFLEYFSQGEGAKPEHLIDNVQFENAINACEAWYWRSQAAVVQQLKVNLEGAEPEKVEARKKMPNQLRNLMENMDSVIVQASERALESKLVESVVDGDFAVNGVKYSTLSQDEVTNLGSIAASRLETLGYLSGNNEFDVEPGQVKMLNPINSLWAPI